jgi:hypothetical protein
LKKEPGWFTCHRQRSFCRAFLTQLRRFEAKKNFIESSAAYSLVVYFLQVRGLWMMSEKDRKGRKIQPRVWRRNLPNWTHRISSNVWILKLVPSKQITEEHGKGLDQNWAGEGSTQWKSAAAIQWPCCSHWLWAAWPAAFFQKYLLDFLHCH